MGPIFLYKWVDNLGKISHLIKRKETKSKSKEIYKKGTEMTKKVPIHIEKIEKKPISNHDNINRIQINQDKSKTKNGTISSSFDEFVDESDDLTYLSNLYLNDLESCLIGYTDPITYDKERY